MRLKRSLLLGAAGLALLLTAPPPARAGGAAFTFDPRAYAPGQRVLGRASFDPTVKGNGRLEDGPFYAYLLPLNEAIPPPAIPDRGVLLGRIGMRMSGLGSAIATISFVMPDVRPGTYVIEPCDDPCRRDIVGDFVGGTIEVVRTPELALIENVRIAVRPDLDEATARVRANLASGIADTRSRQAAEEARQQTLAEQMSRLQSQVDRLTSRDSGSSWSVAMSGWAVAAGIILVAALRRRGPRSRVTVATDLASSKPAQSGSPTS
jgi:hypothetical protein